MSNARTHVQNCRLVHLLPNAVFWIAFLLGQWYANVLLHMCPIREANVNSWYYKHQVVCRIQIVQIKKPVLIDNAATLAIVVQMQYAK